ncbi:MAG TPA: DUF885 domain-containing protein, partial [Dehalococcoidia bacterium]|nr:DUF885 domain-containing protein [Dehalococcoidia bacterium]
EMRTTAERIKPGSSPQEAMELLNTDPARSIDGVEAYQAWLQELHDQVIRDFDGRHFDIPDQIKPIEAKIPPPGGALAPHYVPPSEDFTRPGRTWWPTGTETRFPKWDKVTTAYHEGVPGHHLQLGGALCLGDRLSRFQKVSFISGHGEGWALYSERLMGELGYFENPDYYMGMLSGQALRAVRVIVDIGMHLRLPIPQNEPFHPGEVWNHDLALEFLIQHTGMSPEFMASEVVRYLGLPAQAISYKVGEREWLKARDSVKQKLGSAFDLKRFHTVAIALGPLPLDMLAPEIERAMAGQAP